MGYGNDTITFYIWLLSLWATPLNSMYSTKALAAFSPQALLLIKSSTFPVAFFFSLCYNNFCIDRIA